MHSNARLKSCKVTLSDLSKASTSSRSFKNLERNALGMCADDDASLSMSEADKLCSLFSSLLTGIIAASLQTVVVNKIGKK